MTDTLARSAAVTLLSILLAIAAPAYGGEFCTDLASKYGPAILRCVDFGTANDTAINFTSDSGTATISTHLHDPALSATPGSTGSLHWKIKSYNQVKREEPTLSNGEAWYKALRSGKGVWQRWIGQNYKPGVTYYFQFKYRFNNAAKMWWGGGGYKVFGMGAGCRQDPRDPTGRTWIPALCDATLNLPGQALGGDRITGLGTADSRATNVMTTTNWWPASASAPHRPYPVMYQGSSNFQLTHGYTPAADTPGLGSSEIDQPGPDANGPWDGTALTRQCARLLRLRNPDFVKDSHCVTYGAPDVWHEITMAFRPGKTYNFDPKAPAGEKIWTHDTLLKVWYDGKLIVDFDPDQRPFKPGQMSAAACRGLARQHPRWDECRTGLTLFSDSRDLPLDCATRTPSEDGRCGSSYPVAAAPWVPGDPGADPSQFVLSVLSYRRGNASQAWCDTVIGVGNPRHRTCSGTAGGKDDAQRFEAFLNHAEVNFFFDDWVVSTVPPPMQRRPDGGFGLDARDLDMLPPNTWTRLNLGPNRTWWNTGIGVIPADSPVDTGKPAAPYNGVDMRDCTNLAVEKPVELNVPIGHGGFAAPNLAVNVLDQLGTRVWRMLYFGGGHSGYMANRMASYDSVSGRWVQSAYTPDIGCQLGGAASGPHTPTPPGTGCPIYPLREKFTFTADITAGSAVLRNVSRFREIQTGRVLNEGIPGVPSGAIILAFDATAKTITLSKTATASAGGVPIGGGYASCWTGGHPNGSTGGRGWWEHISDRFGWSPSLNLWVIMQNSGTWLYRDSYAADLPVVAATRSAPISIRTAVPHGLETGQSVTITGVGGNTAANGPGVATVTGPTTFTLDNSASDGTYTSGGFVTETWKRIVGPFKLVGSGLPCNGNLDYAQLSVKYNPDLKTMLAWCSTDRIFKLDLGSGAPDFIGARWVLLYTFPAAERRPGGGFGTMVYDVRLKRMLFLKRWTVVGYGHETLNPQVMWYDPLSAPSCATQPPPCGKGGLVNMAGGPNTKVSPHRDARGTVIPLAEREKHECFGKICEHTFVSMAHDVTRDETFIVSRRAGDARLVLWGLKHPGTPAERWRQLDDFHFNVYTATGDIRLYHDDVPRRENDLQSAHYMLHYLPEENLHLLILRAAGGGGVLGGSTRGGNCVLNGEPDECFKMYALRMDRGR